MKRKDPSLCCSWEGGISRNHQPSRAEVLRLRKRIEELESNAVNQGDKTYKFHSKTYNNNNIDNNVEASDVQATQNMDQDDICVSELGLANARVHTKHYSLGQNPTTPISPAWTQPSIGNPPATNRVSSEPTSKSIESLSGNNHFYGNSSAVSFISQMRNAVQQKLGNGGPTNLPNREDLQTHIMGAAATQRLKSLDYVLPGRRKADKLLTIYWDVVHPLYPFLDKQKFLAQYETLWASQENDADDPVFLCALNLIFALSSQLNLDISPNERQTSADDFFERAKESLDLWHLNTLQSVQMLLLLSIYLQSSCAINQCWMILGVAIRTAQSLGLHLCETSRRILPHRERELVRKVWHTCVLLDRMAAMTYGRPPMITTRIQTKTPMPLSIDEELLPTEGPLPVSCSDQPSIVEFFIQSLRLFDILDEILVAFYLDCLEKEDSIEEVLEKFLGRSAADRKCSIPDIDRRLLEWDKNLPPHLKVQYTSLDSGISRSFARQAVILRQQLVSTALKESSKLLTATRYLHIRLLSMKPILSAYLSNGSGGSDCEATNELSLSERIAMQCSVVCVKVALEMIDLSYGRRPKNPDFVGPTAAWWHNVLFIYSAATVLVAARLSPSILCEIPEDSILQSYSRAIDVLKSFQVFNPVIQRCVAALELIYRVIPDHYSHSRYQPRQYEIDVEEPQDISFQSQFYRQEPSSQGLPNAPPMCEQVMDGLVDCGEDDILDKNLQFTVNDLSWLSVIPFEV